MTMKTNIECDLATILLVVFVVLKLTGVITWSWWWVLAPLWIPVCVVLVLFVIIAPFALIFG